MFSVASTYDGGLSNFLVNTTQDWSLLTGTHHIEKRENLSFGSNTRGNHSGQLADFLHVGYSKKILTANVNS